MINLEEFEQIIEISKYSLADISENIGLRKNYFAMPVSNARKDSSPLSTKYAYKLFLCDPGSFSKVIRGPRLTFFRNIRKIHNNAENFDAEVEALYIRDNYHQIWLNNKDAA